jgi:FkbM family methyltransferase
MAQNNERRALEARSAADTMARLEAYSKAADLNVGRIAALQTRLREQVESIALRLEPIQTLLEAHGERLEGFDHGLEQLRGAVSHLNKSLGTKSASLDSLLNRLSELERGFDRAGLRLTELETTAAQVSQTGDVLVRLDGRVNALSVEFRRLADAQALAQAHASNAALRAEKDMSDRVVATEEKLSERINAIERAEKDIGDRLAAAEQKVSDRIHTAARDIDKRLGSAEYNLTQRVDAGLKEVRELTAGSARHLSDRLESIQRELVKRVDGTAGELRELTTGSERQLTMRLETTERELVKRVDDTAGELRELTTGSERQLTMRLETTERDLAQRVDVAIHEIRELTVGSERHLLARVEAVDRDLLQHIQRLERETGDKLPAALATLSSTVEAADRQIADLKSNIDEKLEGVGAGLDERVASRVVGDVEHSIDIALKNMAIRYAPTTIRDQYLRGLNAVGILNWEDAWVTGELRFLKLFSERFPTATVFDVGANIGRYAMLAREFAPSATVHAFEPHPAAFAKLEASAAKHGFVAHQFALGQKTGTVELFDYADEEVGGGSEHASLYRQVIEVVHQQEAVQISVPCETVDRMAKKLAIASVNLLKIDTEGHELPVLKGAAGLLKSKKIDVIQFEFNEMNVFSRTFFKDFLDFLPEYRFFRLLPDSVVDLGEYRPSFYEVFAFQNIICVRRDEPFEWLYAGTSARKTLASHANS